MFNELVAASVAGRAADWWFHRLSPVLSLRVSQDAFRVHFVHACLAEWTRLDVAQPEPARDVKLLAVFTETPGLFLGQVLKVAAGHKYFRLDACYASMEITPTAIVLEEWDATRGRWAIVDSEPQT